MTVARSNDGGASSLRDPQRVTVIQSAAHCIDLYSIGPNDFPEPWYPGQPDHPEVVKTMQEISRRIRQAGRTMQLDVMQGAWVSDMLLDAGRRILLS